MLVLWFSFRVFNVRTKEFAYKFIWILFWNFCVRLQSSLLPSGFKLNFRIHFAFTHTKLHPLPPPPPPQKAYQREIKNFLAQSFLQPIASSVISPSILIRSSSSEGQIHESLLQWQTNFHSQVTFSLEYVYKRTRCTKFLWLYLFSIRCSICFGLY